MKEKIRTGIMGGSFDPVHLAHTAIAQSALENANLDEIFFIPAHQAPLRDAPTFTPDGARVDMLKLALKDAPYKWQIQMCEIERGGVGYAIDTVKFLEEKYADRSFHWIIGSDHVSKLKNWKNISELATKVDFICAARPDFKIDMRELPTGLKIKFIKFEKMPHSSTVVRDMLGKSYKSNFMLDFRVMNYILEHKLYHKSS